jgi:hypothetical protein
VDRFWNDGGRGLEELPVYAHVTTGPFADVPDDLLQALPEPRFTADRLPLETESREDRDRILTRLARLREAYRRRAWAAVRGIVHEVLGVSTTRSGTR